MELLRRSIIGGCLALLLSPSMSFAMSDIDVLKEKYKDCKVERETAMLSGEPAKFFKSSLYSYFSLKCKNEKLNAFPVTNFVKIGDQKLIVVADSKRVVKSIIKLKFQGGSAYHPTKSWHEKFSGVNLEKIHDVDGLTGATFTSESTSDIMEFVRAVSKTI